MKQRFIVITLLLCVIFSSTIPVCAVEAKDENKIILECVGHGEFLVRKSLTDAAENKPVDKAEFATAGEIVSANSFDGDEILRVSAEKYLIKTADDTYMLADKITINPNDLALVKQVLQHYEISSRYINQIEEVICHQKELKNNDFFIELFVPADISNDSGTKGGQITNSYYTYTDSQGDKWKMRDISIKYSNLSSGMVSKSGTTTKSYASAFVNVVISAAGTVSKTVSVFGVGKSLYDAYVAIHGTVQYSSGGDRTYSSAIFDRIEKTSQVYAEASGSYVTGKTSHKAWVNRLDTYQYYGATGESELIKPSVNEIHYSQYWDNNEKTLSHIGWEDYIEIKLYNTTVALSGTN